MKVAFVVQRYGVEVNGGSEFLCRLIAERMARHWDLEVLTSCAIDYRTWEDFYPPGVTEVNGVRVRRFRVDFPRATLLFDRLSEGLYQNKDVKFLQDKWGREQGPYSSEFLRYLDAQENNKENTYDAFFFFTYLYGFTLLGLPKVAHKSVLIPTAHDEPSVYLPLYRPVFALPRGILFQTPEEKDFVCKTFSIQAPHEVLSTGIEEPPQYSQEDFLKVFAGKIKEPYILYLGRIDESKGCRQLFDYWIRYRESHSQSPLKLLLAGKSLMQIPHHPDILHLGFIDEKFKFPLLKQAVALVMPSPYESLSLVTLEAWLAGTPVLVNKKSPVLTGQCLRSGGGFAYESYEEMDTQITQLVSQSDLREKMGTSGQKYVRENYLWETVESGYLKWANQVGASSKL